MSEKKISAFLATTQALAEQSTDSFLQGLSLNELVERRDALREHLAWIQKRAEAAELSAADTTVPSWIFHAHTVHVAMMCGFDRGKDGPGRLADILETARDKLQDRLIVGPLVVTGGSVADLDPPTTVGDLHSALWFLDNGLVVSDLINDLRGPKGPETFKSLI